MNVPNIKFNGNSAVGAALTDGRTDVTKLIVTFCEYAKARDVSVNADCALE
jgi:hypothetical protein